MVVGVLNFVDELVNFNCVEGFDHFECGEDCSLRGFFVEACEYGVVLWWWSVLL